MYIHSLSRGGFFYQHVLFYLLLFVSLTTNIFCLYAIQYYDEFTKLGDDIAPQSVHRPEFTNYSF